MAGWTLQAQLRGPQGTQGVQGPQGAKGAQGSQGNTGTTGGQGSQGATGSQGAQGSGGPQGLQGSTGPQGVQGNQGLIGSQGLQGSAGVQGPQGYQGSQGYIPVGPTPPANPYDGEPWIDTSEVESPVGWGSGAFALIPAGTASGAIYFAEDVNGGTLYQDLTDAGPWTQLAPGVDQAGTGGGGGAGAQGPPGSQGPQGPQGIAGPNPLYGTYAAMPAGTGSRALYVANDINGGAVYQDQTNGGPWTQVTPGRTEASGQVPGMTELTQVVDVVAFGTAWTDLPGMSLAVPARAAGGVFLRAKFDININPNTTPAVGTAVSVWVAITDQQGNIKAFDIAQVQANGTATGQSTKAVLEFYLPAPVAAATYKIQARLGAPATTGMTARIAAGYQLVAGAVNYFYWQAV